MCPAQCLLSVSAEMKWALPGWHRAPTAARAECLVRVSKGVVTPECANRLSLFEEAAISSKFDAFSVIIIIYLVTLGAFVKHRDLSKCFGGIKCLVATILSKMRSSKWYAADNLDHLVCLKLLSPASKWTFDCSKQNRNDIWQKLWSEFSTTQQTVEQTKETAVGNVSWKVTEPRYWAQ